MPCESWHCYGDSYLGWYPCSSFATLLLLCSSVSKQSGIQSSLTRQYHAFPCLYLFFYPLLHPKKEYFVVIFLLIQSGNKSKICDLDFCNLMCFLFANVVALYHIIICKCQEFVPSAVVCNRVHSSFSIWVVAGSIKWESLLTMGREAKCVRSLIQKQQARFCTFS